MLDSVSPATEEIVLNDWIWDCHWLQSACSTAPSETLCTEGHTDDLWPESMAVALGHNSVVELAWRSGAVLREVHCLDKCILYPDDSFTQT